MFTFIIKQFAPESVRSDNTVQTNRQARGYSFSEAFYTSLFIETKQATVRKDENNEKLIKSS